MKTNLHPRPPRPSYFEVGDIFHIYNRGVEKRNIVTDDHDRFRFVHDLFEFNDEHPAPAPHNLSQGQLKKLLEIGFPRVFLGGTRGPRPRDRRPRERVVDLLSWCLMPNHYHLMVRQRTEGGITKFMRKLGVGYTNYFNERHERVGALFQGKFKAVQLTNDAHFLYLPYYIHLNPLDFNFPAWREGLLDNPKEAFAELSSYRWSSYLDYIDKKNFPSLLQRRDLVYHNRSPKEFEKDMRTWLSRNSTDTLNDIIFDS